MKFAVACMLFVLSAGAVFGQGLDPETSLAVRLWAPEDIEEYAREIASNRIDVVGNDAVTNGILAFQDRTGIDLGWSPQIREEVMMRRVAYGVLKYWPSSMQAVQDHQAGERSLNYNSPVYGKDLLIVYWRNWSAAWHRLWRYGIDTSVATQKEQVAGFEKDWGKWDAEDPPRKIPKGYLPEETDGIWYLAIDSEDDLLLKAVMEKRRGLLGEWGNENTRVISYYAGKSHELAAPFPDPVLFFFHPHNNKLKMTTDYHFNLRETLKSRGYVNVAWQPKFSWSRMVKKSPRLAQRTKLSFETEYPRFNWKIIGWDYLPVKVSAVKFDDWENGLDHVRTVRAMTTEEIGAMMRAWAGPHATN